MISIIIPVHNEEKNIKKILNSFYFDNKFEVIVVDGESQDRTVEFAQEYPVKVIQSVRNRAVQMNAGVKLAAGNNFLFLHADCLLADGSLDLVGSCLADGYIGGCFEQKIVSNQIIYRLIETSGNIRAKLFKIFYGDQAIFVRRDVFSKIGGFDYAELFEDIIFSKKLKRLGRTCVLHKKVYTSERRWKKQGILKTTLINWFLTVAFLCGVSPQRLKGIYQDVR